MKNRFIISETEKERILGLHEQATLPNPMAKGNALSNSTLTTNTIKSPVVTTTSPATIIGDKLYQAIMTLKTGDPTNDGLVDKSIQLLSRPDIKLELTDMISTFKTSDELNLKLSSLASSPKPGEKEMSELIKKAVYIIRPDLSTPTTPVTSTPSPIQLGVENPKIKTIQELLNSKYQSGLVPDGKWGPKTAAALKKALDAKKGGTPPQVVSAVSSKVANPPTIA
jgi:hypothetical protein